MTDVAALGFSVDSTGLTQATAALNAMAAAGPKVDKTTDDLNRSMADLNVTLNRMTVALQNNTSETAKHSAVLGALPNAARAAAGGLTAAAGATNALSTATRAATGVHKAHSAALGNSSMALMEFEHSVRAVTDSVLAGFNPIRALTMEAPRIIQAWGTAGGASGVMKLFGDVVGKVANPVALTVAALAALGAGGAAAFITIENRMTALQRATMGLGATTGATAASLRDLGLATAGRGVTPFQAMEVLRSATSVGISTSVSGLIPGEVQHNFAKMTDQSTSAAGQQLVDLLKDPTKGAAEVQKQFGLLSDAEQQMIDRMAASGDKIGAQTELLNQLAAAADKSAKSLYDSSNGLQKWNEAAVAASHNFEGNVEKFLLGVGGVIAPSYDQQLKHTYDRGAERSQYRTAVPQRLADMYAGYDDAGELLRRRNAQADRDVASSKADAISTQKSQEAGDIVRSISPDIGQRQALEDQVRKLSAALATPGAIDKMGVSAGDAQKALDQASSRLAYFATGTERVAQSSALASAAAEAWTANERTAIEAQKAWTDTMRQSGDAAEAAAQSLATWNQAIAESNKRANEALLSAEDELREAGMTPHQKRVDQINNRTRDAIRDSATGPAGGIYAPSNVPASSPTSAPTGVSQNEMRMFRLLVSAGYPPAAAAGFVGGLTGESRIELDPTIVNPKSGAYGIAQALTPPRKAAYMAVPPTLDAQGRVVLDELSGPEAHAAARLRSAGTVQGGLDANIAFERPYANSGMSQSKIDADYAKRLAAGNALLAAVGGQSGPARPAGTPSDEAPPLTVRAQNNLQPSTAVDAYSKVRNAALLTNDIQEQTGPLKEANLALDERQRQLDTLSQSYGKSAVELAALNAEDALQNQYWREKVTLTPKILEGIEQVGQRAKEQAQQQLDLQRQQQAYSDIRNIGSGIIDTIASGLANKQHVHQTILSRVGLNIGQNLMSMGERDLTSSLFGGGPGGTKGGFIGDLLMNLFHFGGSGAPSGVGHNAGGTDNWRGGYSVVGESGPEIVNIPRGAQVIPNNKIGGARGATAGHTFNFGDVHIHPVGGAQFTPDQISAIRGHVAAGQSDTVKQIQRHVGDMQASWSQDYSRSS